MVDKSVKVGTGYTVKLILGNKIVDMATVIIMGDVNGDSCIDSTDYLRIKGAFLGTFSLSDASAKASDIDKSSSIDSTDYLRIKGHFLGIYSLS